MRAKRGIGWAWGVVVLAVVAGTAWADIVIDTVPVGNPGNAADRRYPSGEVAGFGGVDAEYRVGKYEVTAGQYTAFLNAVAATDVFGLYSTDMWTNERGCKIQRLGLSGSYTYIVAADRADRPVNYVSWGDAARFANWLHNGQPTGAQGLSTTEDGAYNLNGATTPAQLMAVNRRADWCWAIPTEDEWYKAAYHQNDGVTGNYWLYPTGADTLPSNQLGHPDPGNNANFYQQGVYTLGGPYWQTVAGEFENSDGPYGTFDQGGNVAEWSEAVFLGDSRVARGGSFAGILGLHAADRAAFLPAEQLNTVGFRVVQIPEPASLALLALGGIGLLTQRRGLRR